MLSIQGVVVNMLSIPPRFTHSSCANNTFFAKLGALVNPKDKEMVI